MGVPFPGYAHRMRATVTVRRLLCQKHPTFGAQPFLKDVRLRRRLEHVLNCFMLVGSLPKQVLLCLSELASSRGLEAIIACLLASGTGKKSGGTANPRLLLKHGSVHFPVVGFGGIA